MKLRTGIPAFLAICCLLAACQGDKTDTEGKTESTGNAAAVQSTAGASDETQTETESIAEKREAENTAELPCLKEIYGTYGMKAGTCLSPEMIHTPAYESLIREQFNSVTMENLLKPEAILNREESRKAGNLVVEFSPELVELLDWTREKDMAVRGHTFVWYSQTPDWIYYEDFDPDKKFVSREEMLLRMESYISQVFGLLDEGGYLDQFYAYDVVNEALMEDGTLRENNWKTIIGDDYLWYAFSYADAYAPDSVDLYLNDYNEQYKPYAISKIVKTLVDENGRSLVDGIGLQAHLYTQDDYYKYFQAVDTLAATGLKLEITELDMSLGTWQQTLEANEENLSLQGERYQKLIAGLIDRIEKGSLSMDAITFWGFADPLSWKSETYPLLFDGNLDPKPAFFGAALEEE